MEPVALVKNFVHALLNFEVRKKCAQNWAKMARRVAKDEPLAVVVFSFILFYGSTFTNR